MDALRGAAALVAACMGWCCLPAGAQAPQTGSMVVGADEQAARDTDRVRILRDELAREEAAAADATKRRAEHLSTSDLRAAERDEQAQQRAAENIAALRRELDAATRAQANAMTASARARSPAPRSATTATAQAPWWDVYAKPPRRATTQGPPSPLAVRPSPTDPAAMLPNR